MISELYMNQEAVIRIAGGESDSGIIGRGVRQGCPLSPLLFSIYAELMMKEALENVEEGIRVGGELIKAVKYADDCQYGSRITELDGQPKYSSETLRYVYQH